MKYLSYIQKGVDFIEAHLDQPIDVAQVAQESCMSQWHFQRTFKALTGETLKTYIRSRRLSVSLIKLLNPDIKILDIALGSGFESQESYTRAFKKAFSMTPGEFRQIGNQHKFLQKVQFNQTYLTHINQNINSLPEIIDVPERKLVGLKTTYFGVDSEKNNMGEKLPALWEAFRSAIENIPNQIDNNGYGVIESKENAQGELNYYATLEVSEFGELPSGLITKVLPAQKYAKFTHRGSLESLNNTVNFIYSTWLNNADYEYANFPDIEIYNSDYNPKNADSVMYYCVPIK
jgi:AraC family transcriptional regulator